MLNLNILNSRTLILSITFISILFATYVVGGTPSPQKTGDIKMINWSLGRIDFNLPKQYKLLGRSQNIYYVDVSTTPIEKYNFDDIFNKKLNLIKEQYIKMGNEKDSLQIKDVDEKFRAIFYHDDPTNPNVIKLSALMSLEENILAMNFEGQKGKEDDMIRGISIIANSFHKDIPYGFNVGSGSITSTPGLNEYTHSSFNDPTTGITINISTQVATSNLNNHPLYNIKDEIKGLAEDGVILTVIHNQENTVADLNGHEGHISLDDGKNDTQFRYTWFTQGETANSFKPEILIKAQGPLKNMNSFKTTWNTILKSLKIREKDQ